MYVIKFKMFVKVVIWRDLFLIGTRIAILNIIYIEFLNLHFK